MEIWRVGYEEDRLPAVISRLTLTVALILHLLVFVIFWLYAACHDLFHKDEEIIPIDLTVVVNENLDGKENEPPPLKKPDPPKPKPKPQPKPKPKEPEKPKELEKIVTNIVTEVEKKEPEKPKKTAKELREERMQKMRESAKVVNKKVTIEVRNAKESGNGRTEKQPKDWEKYFNQGYEPGSVNQLAASEEQLAQKLIRDYIYAKWDRPPWTDTLRPILVQVWFGNGGKILRYELKSGSGDTKADRTALSAISRATVIPRLPPAFIDKYRKTGYTLRFKVTAQ